MLLMNGRKMSKSDGNTISPMELITGDSPHVTKGYSPMIVKFFMLQSHYSSTLDLTDEALQAAEKGYKKLMEAFKNLKNLNSSTSSNGAIDDELLAGMEACFAEMDDDFSTPKAIARLFELVPKINSLKDGVIALDQVSNEALDQLREGFSAMIHDVFGLLDEADSMSGGGPVDGLMEVIIELRAHARTNKDWTTSDLIRDRLNELDILIKDGKDGTEWSYK